MPLRGGALRGMGGVISRGAAEMAPAEGGGQKGWQGTNLREIRK